MTDMLYKTYQRWNDTDTFTYSQNGKRVASVDKNIHSAFFVLYENNKPAAVYKTLRDAEQALSESLDTPIKNAA